MSIYAELDPIPERRTQFAKRENIAKVNIPILAYSNQHIDTEIPYGSTDHVRYFRLILKLSQQTKHTVL